MGIDPIHRRFIYDQLSRQSKEAVERESRANSTHDTHYNGPLSHDFADDKINQVEV